MDAVIVQPRTKEEVKFIGDLLQRLGLNSHRISESELEDYGLAIMMKEVDRSKKASSNSVMRKLRRT